MKSSALEPTLNIVEIRDAQGDSQYSDFVGHSAKMREAILKILWSIDFISKHTGEENTRAHLSKTIALARAAIDEPPRNCDVGTPEMQAARMRTFCKKYRAGIGTCIECPVSRTFPKDCALAWAQMPYEKGENNGSKC